MIGVGKNSLSRRDYVRIVSVFLIVVVLLSGFFLLLEQQMTQASRTRYQYLASSEASVIQQKLDTVFAKVSILRSLIRAEDGSTEFFDSEVPRIYQEAVEESGISLKNMAVAPDGVMAKAYPLAGNEALIGFDLMDETRAGNAGAILAYQNNELVITNPFELVQGGMGMSGRIPVFLEQNGESDFWGLVSVTIDFDSLLKAFQLDDFVKMDIDYQLWYSDEDGSRVVIGGSEDKLKWPVSYQFYLYNLTWNLDVAPKHGWNNYSRLLELIVVLTVGVLVAILLIDKAKLRHANESLKFLANQDSLTRCCSRHYVNMELINQRTGQWNDPHVCYSLAMIDIDYFKGINDTFGHEIGDRAIVAVAQVLLDLAKVENGDCVIRYGGDEFVVLYNDVSWERFLEKLHGIVEQVRGIRFADVPGLRLTVSVGGVYSASELQSCYYDMIEQADQRLYEAKESGRDQYCCPNSNAKDLKK